MKPATATPACTYPRFGAMKQEFLAACPGVTDIQIDAVAAKLSFKQIIALLWQFGSQFGPIIFGAITGVLEDIANGTITNPATILALINLYGPPAYDLAVAVAALFGIVLPPLPPGTSKPQPGTLLKTTYKP